MTNNPSVLTPPANTKVHFVTSTAFVRHADIHNHGKSFKCSSKHRGIRVTLDIGYILIEKRWFSSKQKKSKK